MAPMPTGPPQFDAARSQRPITLREALSALRPGQRTLETRATWSRRLPSVEKAPEVFRPALDPGPDGLPYAVFTPSLQVGLLRRTHPQVWSNGSSAVRTLVDAGGEIREHCYPLAGISHLRVTKTLLRTWISLAGTGPDGKPQTASVEINTVTDSLFDPILDRIRGGNGDTGRPQPLTEAAGPLGRKFAILAGRALLPGDRVEQAVPHPARRGSGSGPPWARNGLLAPARLALLTERELILITDDGSRGAVAESGYGGIRDHIPRHREIGVTLEEAGSDLLELALHLPGGHVLTARFDTACRPALERLVASLPA